MILICLFRYPCSLCEKTFNAADQLIKHKSNLHCKSFKLIAQGICYILFYNKFHLNKILII